MTPVVLESADNAALAVGGSPNPITVLRARHIIETIENTVRGRLVESGLFRNEEVLNAYLRSFTLQIIGIFRQSMQDQTRRVTDYDLIEETVEHHVGQWIRARQEEKEALRRRKVAI